MAPTAQSTAHPIQLNYPVRKEGTPPNALLTKWYPPPALGIDELSSAYDVPSVIAESAPNKYVNIIAGPAEAIALPVMTKIVAPIAVPTPIKVV